ncbi:calcium-binding protein [uncultured Stenotrophomonas sp.]|uniref:calcium-binding protein n=1 Tax=uncultured Stenotrophomonas sp. TaxID=165438 RepID=UPI0028EA84F3|nr:calcium-binding protein [uncultured Stenotrophomonas sp.]
MYGSAFASPATGVEGTATQIMTLAGDHRLVVLGEFHGTAETPLLVADLMERYSRDNAPVRLGLELPMSENAALARYLRSSGDADAKEALRTSPFWRVKDDQHDGRRSRDMLALIETLRVLRAQGRDVGVAGYDTEISAYDNEVDRDAEMAKHVRQQFNALPAPTRMLVLTGNVHAMRHPFEDAPAEMQHRTMASYLVDLPLYSVRVEALRGQFWGCMKPCRALTLREQQARDPLVEMDADRSYDAWVFLPELSVGTLTGP